MSPTYWTASQIKAAVREHGWEFIRAAKPTSSWDIPAWGAKKGRCTVMVTERRDGGLLGVWLTYPKSSGSNCDYYGPRSAGKLDTVLKFIKGCK